MLEPDSGVVKLKIGEYLDLSCYGDSVYKPTEIQLFHNDVRIYLTLI